MTAHGPKEPRFRALFEAHYADVWRYARRRVGADAAADAAAEVFVVVWRRLDEAPATPLPWLYGIARRVCANQLRGAQRRLRLTERMAVATATSAQSISTSGDTDLDGDSAVAAAFDRLSDADREVLALVVWEGLGARDAGRVLGCSAAAVTMRLHRARRRLRELLEQSGSHAGENRGPTRDEE